MTGFGPSRQMSENEREEPDRQDDDTDRKQVSERRTCVGVLLCAGMTSEQLKFYANQSTSKRLN